MSTHLIRLAQSCDATEVARLLTQLGHPTQRDWVRGRWSDWANAGNVALVAEEQNTGPLLGLVTMHQMIVLHRLRPVGRITALIVDAQSRGKGIGRSLVAAAETHFAHRGCGMLEITSHFRLPEAHAFYEHLGYGKTSVRLAKQLSVSDTPR